MADITQKLPPELLMEILGHVPVRDVLKFKQVNRVFHDAVLASPLIQHKIDLFAAGLEYNAASGIDLVESRKAFLQYSSSLDSLRPIEERVVGGVQVGDDYWSKTAGGVHAVFADSVRLFSLGSASRGIPHKQWEIPSPTRDPMDYYIYPGANLIAFVDMRTSGGYTRIKIYLRALSNGGRHPMAQYPTIEHSWTDLREFSDRMSITGSRLAILAVSERGSVLAIWDWKSAELLFDLEAENYNSITFIDDYWLLAGINLMSDLPPCLVLINTEGGGETPMQTTFHLPPQFDWFQLLSEQGVLEPSPEESLAPFCPDPAQRIVILQVHPVKYYLAVSVGALLELGSCGGTEMGWDEWRSRVLVPRLFSYETELLWVSGCRLFSICPTESSPEGQMQVYDFSKQGRARYLNKEADQSFGGLRCLSPTPAQATIPYDTLLESCGGHDSIIFPHYVRGEGPIGDQWVWHIWSF